jgi:hypothetical protein
MPITRDKTRELLRDAEFAANRLAHQAKIAARDARTIELRRLRLARDAEMAKGKRSA